jgi:excisionase family DNA binding protein
MAQISVAEAARRLGVGVQRIHQRINDGSLRAIRIGHQWVIDEEFLVPASESRAPGRPLSHRSAWALLAASRADETFLKELAPVERARARDRLRNLLVHSMPGTAVSAPEVRAVASSLRLSLRNRAERRLYRASPRDLPDVRDDNRIVLSGLSHPRSGIASGGLVEGYVASADLDAVVGDYLLSAVVAPTDANVVLHVASAVRPDSDDIAPLLLAADLAEHRGPREEIRAAELLREVVTTAHELCAGEDDEHGSGRTVTT